MSIEMEGALNRLTAATMTVAQTAELHLSDGNISRRQAGENVQNRFERHMSYIMER